eukprot:gene8260-5780_t
MNFNDERQILKPLFTEGLLCSLLDPLRYANRIEIESGLTDAAVRMFNRYRQPKDDIPPQRNDPTRPSPRDCAFIHRAVRQGSAKTRLAKKEDRRSAFKKFMKECREAGRQHLLPLMRLGLRAKDKKLSTTDDAVVKLITTVATNNEHITTTNNNNNNDGLSVFRCCDCPLTHYFYYIIIIIVSIHSHTRSLLLVISSQFYMIDSAVDYSSVMPGSSGLVDSQQNADANSIFVDQWYHMPFPPYDVQREMMKFIQQGLNAKGRDAVPVLALEVPTGCGKTMALLSAVLQFQQCGTTGHRTLQTIVKATGGKTQILFLYVNSQREMEQEVKDCEIMSVKGSPVNYVRQVTRELRRLSKYTSSQDPCLDRVTGTSGSSSLPTRRCPLRMNILGSRDYYCINAAVQKAKGSGALPHEGNNLGEVCDKLVSLSQCPCVENYEGLACSAIDGHGIGNCRNDPVWDLEDLVMEGVKQQKCPYYAARDLVFHADISLCTYQYLLDPIIRHECHFEGALNNNSIIIFDEAHNIASVCEDALSIQGTTAQLDGILNALSSVVSPPEEETTSLSYPRSFPLSSGITLLDIFAFALSVLRELKAFFIELGSAATPLSLQKSLHYVSASALVERLKKSAGGQVYCSKQKGAQEPLAFSAMFRQLYGIIFSLGVTFNPFELPIHYLALLKRWLLILRFVLEKPEAFALHASVSPDDSSIIVSNVRCVDGSLAFFHLLRSTFRIILASGTLSPFPHLSKALGLSGSLWKYMEGDHVVSPTQFAAVVLSRSGTGASLRSTYASLSSDKFLLELANTIITLSACVQKGGVVIMVPNYSVLYKLKDRILDVIGQSPYSNHCVLDGSRVFVEPRHSSETQHVLEHYKATTRGSVALFIGVFRGKLGEGLDFSDEMARMVICVGIPFRPIKSWSVAAKRHYSSEEWYVGDAMCAVNQALGRCLRHANDYGAIILLDERYAESHYKSKVSHWCRKAVEVHTDLDTVCRMLRDKFEEWFQQNISSTLPTEMMPMPSVQSPLEPPKKILNVKGAPGMCLALSGGTTALSVGVIDEAALLAPVKKGSLAHTHTLASTVVKLLYEEHNDTKERVNSKNYVFYLFIYLLLLSLQLVFIVLLVWFYLHQEIMIKGRNGQARIIDH